MYDLLPDHPDMMAQTWYGIVANSPVGFASLLMVTIPSFDPQLTWGPCFWQARDAVTLPVKGDKCLIIFDEQRQPWVIAWWPF